MTHTHSTQQNEDFQKIDAHGCSQLLQPCRISGRVVLSPPKAKTNRPCYSAGNPVRNQFLRATWKARNSQHTKCLWPKIQNPETQAVLFLPIHKGLSISLDLIALSYILAAASTPCRSEMGLNLITGSHQGLPELAVDQTR